MLSSRPDSFIVVVPTYFTLNRQRSEKLQQTHTHIQKDETPFVKRLALNTNRYFAFSFHSWNRCIYHSMLFHFVREKSVGVFNNSTHPKVLKILSVVLCVFFINIRLFLVVLCLFFNAYSNAIFFASMIYGYRFTRFAKIRIRKSIAGRLRQIIEYFSAYALCLYLT